MIHKLAQRIKAALRRRTALLHDRAELSEAGSGNDVPMSLRLAADTGHDIDFQPQRLGLTDRDAEPRVETEPGIKSP